MQRYQASQLKMQIGSQPHRGVPVGLQRIKQHAWRGCPPAIRLSQTHTIHTSRLPSTRALSASISGEDDSQRWSAAEGVVSSPVTDAPLQAPVPSKQPALALLKRLLPAATCCACVGCLLAAGPAAAAATAAAAVQPSSPTAGPVVVAGVGGLLVGIGSCIFASAFAVLVFFAVPTMLAWRKTATALALLARVAAEELPDTAAAMRLGGMEVTDAIEELSLLGSDLTAGVRNTAANFEAAQAAVRGSGAAVRAASDRLLPHVRGAAEAVVQERAALPPVSPDLKEAARNAGLAAKRARAAITGVDLLKRAGIVGKRMQRERGQQEPKYSMERPIAAHA
mmetsp:Transcript_21051/g.63345  ORF Transcript_21051/g.63345 Transcript_21051/m.63345 type:complete len:338 (+) Transcript_21051:250-1263(+)